MPRSEKSMRAWAVIDFSLNRPMVMKTGALRAMLNAGLALWATTQMLQVAASFWLGCVWVNSTAAVHNIRDRQSHAEQRTQNRIQFPAFGIRLVSAYKGYLVDGNVPKVIQPPRPFTVAQIRLFRSQSFAFYGFFP